MSDQWATEQATSKWHLPWLQKYEWSIAQFFTANSQISTGALSPVFPSTLWHKRLMAMSCVSGLYHCGQWCCEVHPSSLCSSWCRPHYTTEDSGITLTFTTLSQVVSNRAICHLKCIEVSRNHCSVNKFIAVMEIRIISFLEMIALSTVQLFVRILIHDAILFINTSTMLGTLANWAAIFGDHC